MTAMAMRTAVEDPDHERSQCWCCGAIEESSRLVHLGNHPEVALCARCARWAAKQAWELEDREKTGPLVITRDRFRTLRRSVVEHGWQHNPIFGGPLRWIGRHLP